MKFIQQNSLVLFLVLIFSLFVIYGTIIPFNLSGFESALKKTETIAWHPFFSYTGNRGSFADMFQNVLLFIPIGFLWGIFFLRTKKHVIGFFATVLYGMTLSSTVEMLQLFTDDRVVSITDVIFNTFGTAIGFICSVLVWFMVFKFIVIPKLRSLILSSAFLPFLFMLIVIFGEILQPFDFSLDPGAIFEKIRGVIRDPLQWPQVLRDEPAVILFYMVLSSFVLQLKNVFPVRITSIQCVVLTGLIVITLESVQFIILSRMPAVSDICIGLVGVTLGLLINLFAQNHKFLFVTVFTTCAYFFKAFSPFEFSSQYQPVNWLPFLSEYAQTTMTSLGNVIELVVIFLFAGYYTFRETHNVILRNVLSVFWGILIISFEFLQGWVVGRYPDVSDIIVACVSFIAGVLFCIRIENRLKRAMIEMIDEVAD